MKKILIFSLVYYPRFIGGAEVAVKEITDRLAHQNFAGQNLGGQGADFEFDMVTLRKHAPAFERVGSVNVYRVGFPWRGGKTSSSRIFPFSKYLYILFAFFKALSLHRKNRYDLVWSVMANYAGFAALFFKLSHPRVPFLLTLQEGDPFSHIKSRVGVFYPIFKKIFTKADRIQAISNYLAEWARSMGAKVPVEVVPNGVDVEKFQITNHKSQTNLKLERAEMRIKLGWGENDAVIITTSRLVEKNGVGDIVESLKFLPDNVKLLIVGTGQLEESLKFKVESLKLGGRVHFAGFVSHDELPAYLWASDIFCRPSLSEGMGNSFIEAMAAGLPVIATPVGGIPDFLSAPLPYSEEEKKLLSNSRELESSWGQRITGLFCRVNDPQDIARKVGVLLDNPALRECIVRNASKMVSERYDWSLVAAKMGEIFRKM